MAAQGHMILKWLESFETPLIACCVLQLTTVKVLILFKNGCLVAVNNYLKDLDNLETLLSVW